MDLHPYVSPHHSYQKETLAPPIAQAAELIPTMVAAVRKATHWWVIASIRARRSRRRSDSPAGDGESIQWPYVSTMSQYLHSLSYHSGLWLNSLMCSSLSINHSSNMDCGFMGPVFSKGSEILFSAYCFLTLLLMIVKYIVWLLILHDQMKVISKKIIIIKYYEQTGHLQ